METVGETMAVFAESLADGVRPLIQIAMASTVLIIAAGVVSVITMYYWPPRFK